MSRPICCYDFFENQVQCSVDILRVITNNIPDLKVARNVAGVRFIATFPILLWKPLLNYYLIYVYSNTNTYHAVNGTRNKPFLVHLSERNLMVLQIVK